MSLLLPFSIHLVRTESCPWRASTVVVVNEAGKIQGQSMANPPFPPTFWPLLSERCFVSDLAHKGGSGEFLLSSSFNPLPSRPPRCCLLPPRARPLVPSFSTHWYVQHPLCLLALFRRQLTYPTDQTDIKTVIQLSYQASRSSDSSSVRLYHVSNTVLCDTPLI